MGSFHTYQPLRIGTELTASLNPGSVTVNLDKLFDLFGLSFLIGQVGMIMAPAHRSVVGIK